MKVTERIRAVWLSLQTGTLRILPFVVIRLPNHMKRTNACSSPIFGFEMPDSQVGHFPLFNCPHHTTLN
jgi:hypothetical protein